MTEAVSCFELQFSQWCCGGCQNECKYESTTDFDSPYITIWKASDWQWVYSCMMIISNTCQYGINIPEKKPTLEHYHSWIGLLRPQTSTILKQCGILVIENRSKGRNT